MFNSDLSIYSLGYAVISMSVWDSNIQIKMDLNNKQVKFIEHNTITFIKDNIIFIVYIRKIDAPNHDSTYFMAPIYNVIGSIIKTEQRD